MPTATWRSYKQVSIDGVLGEVAIAQIYVGVVNSGTTKNQRSRALFSFNLAATPDEGTPPTPAAPLVSADLLLEISEITGASGWPFLIQRISRDDYRGHDTNNPYGATWSWYDATPPPARLSWTSPGGDISTPPADLTAYGPTALGAYTAPGLLPFVQDAYQNRQNRVHLRLAALNENPATSAIFASYKLSTDALRPALTLTYGAASTIDQQDPIPLPSDRLTAPSRPASAGAPAAPARPARPSR
ncbi:MAG: hypothetical protein IVW53_14590 [Chloroflexi bacterium]|nr:hypothetical protein [Chloroflexota bacterium]